MMLVKHGNIICVRKDLSFGYLRCMRCNVDGDYKMGMAFYDLAIGKLRVYCQKLSNPTEKQQGAKVCSSMT